MLIVDWVMFLIFGEVLRFCNVAKAVPESPVWTFLCHHQSHVTWIGCSLHDLFSRRFHFLVGTALPFSIANRTRKGQSKGSMTAHASWRALLLVLLGVFLRSTGSNQTNWTFEDTLSQIGLGGRVSFSTRISKNVAAMDCVRLNPGRLLAGIRPVSAAWA